MRSAVLCCTLLSCLLVETVQAEPRRFALIVGVKEYPATELLPKLAFTEPDAEKLTDTLKSHGFSVTLMTQTAARGEGQQRFAPNAAFIRKQFADLVGTPFLKDDDCLLLILGGHGIQLPSKDNAAAQTYYFCPADAVLEGLTHAEDVQPSNNLIKIEELYNTLNESKAGVKLLVVDACRNDPNKPSVFKSSNTVTRPPIPTPPGGMVAMFSCSENQRAVEDSDLRHGVFSYFLIEGLTGAADVNKDLTITITELHEYVGLRVYNFVREKYSHRQLPELSGKLSVAALVTLNSIPEVKPIPNPMPTNPKPPTTTAMIGSRAGDLWENNSLKLQFRWCPPGSYLMGSPESEPGRLSDEKQQTVNFTQGFWMGQYEVTQGEWYRLMGTSPWLTQNGAPEGTNYPVQGARWNDAIDFVQKLTAQERQLGNIPADWEFTIPLESEWEYAARAGSTTAYYFGDDPGNAALPDYAWFEANASNVGNPYPSLVGQKKPNSWSLYDMCGNLWELCNTDIRVRITDPNDTATGRVMKGGCYNSKAKDLRCGARGLDDTDSYYAMSPVVGLRVVLVPVNQNRTQLLKTNPPSAPPVEPTTPKTPLKPSGDIVPGQDIPPIAPPVNPPINPNPNKLKPSGDIVPGFNPVPTNPNPGTKKLNPGGT